MRTNEKPITLQRRQISNCLIVITLFFVLLLSGLQPRIANSSVISNAMFSKATKNITLDVEDSRIANSFTAGVSEIFSEELTKVKVTNQTNRTSLCAGVSKVFQVALVTKKTSQGPLCAGVSKVFQASLASKKTSQEPLCAGVSKVFMDALNNETEASLQKSKNENESVGQTLSQEEKTEYVSTPYVIECTAYCPTGRPCYDEKWPQEGETVAGKKSWIGKKCNLYYINENGNVGEKIGTYQFHDTGFGNDPDGDGIGSIETGERIDLFIEDYDRAMEWGEKYIYIEFLN